MSDKQTKKENLIGGAIGFLTDYHKHTRMAVNLVDVAESLVKDVRTASDGVYLLSQVLIGSAELHLHTANQNLINACGTYHARGSEKETKIEVVGDILYILDDDGEKVYAYSMKDKTRVAV